MKVRKKITRDSWCHLECTLIYLAQVSQSEPVLAPVSKPNQPNQWFFLIKIDLQCPKVRKKFIRDS